MREVEFRGISQYTGKMVYGQLLRGENNFNIVTYFGRVIDIELVPIKKGTQGQYTGLKDKNGRKVFDGDIIEIEYTEYEEKSIHQVVWGGNEYPAWDVKPFWDSECNPFSDIACTGYYTMQVIGNIYENPELLEVAK